MTDTQPQIQEELNNLLEQAWEVRFSAPTECYTTAQKAVVLARQGDFREEEIRALAYQSLGAVFLSHHTEALTIAVEAENLSRNNGNYLLGRIFLLEGIAHRNLGNYDHALELLFEATRADCNQHDSESLAIAFYNIGGIYVELHKADEALQYYERSIQLAQSIEPTFLARALNGVGNVYAIRKQFAEAREMHLLCLEIFQHSNNKLGIARVYTDLGVLALNEGDVETALEYHHQALALRQEMQNTSSMITSHIRIAEVYITQEHWQKALESLQCGLALAEGIEAKPKLKEVYRLLAEAYEQTGNLKDALDSLKKYKTISEEIFNDEATNRLLKLQTGLAIEQSQREAELQRKKHEELQELYDKIKQQHDLLEEQAAAIQLANVELQEKQILLELEKNKSDHLLLNILPSRIADELKRGSRTIAEHFSESSVLFADIVGFTALSGSIPPQEIVKILDEIFSRFDLLAAELGIEKIKTIGDAYMAVSGLPSEMPLHAQAMANMALAMLSTIEEYNKESGVNLQIRIGLNIGPVVAGVIGRKKYAYDLWGDTVNVASRMEALGRPGRIHCTGSVKDVLQHEFHFEERGLIHVKGKGTVQTYYLLGAKSNDISLPILTTDVLY